MLFRMPCHAIAHEGVDADASSDDQPSQLDPDGGTSATYFGICRLAAPGSLHRRIDLKVYPVAEFPFALLAFTGSGPFNRSMRLFARKAGFSLSDHNIRPAQHARGVGRGQRIWAGQPLAGTFHCERDIFDFLGLAFREPWQREVDAEWLAATCEAASTSAASHTIADGHAAAPGTKTESLAAALRPHVMQVLSSCSEDEL